MLLSVDVVTGLGQLLAGQLLGGHLRPDICSLGHLLARTLARLDTCLCGQLLARTFAR